nr:reductive dehalogenase [Dehalococcoides mccartyi]
MKGLGLAGTGVGATTLIKPNFHDLDEVASSDKGVIKYPWYVKDREFGNPTVEIDWNKLKRRDRTGEVDRTAMLAAGGKTWDQFYDGMEVFAKQRWPQYKGATTRDWALLQTCMRTWDATKTAKYDVPRPEDNWGPSDFHTIAKPPMPKWEGTPEENMRTVTAALRFMGWSSIRVSEVNDVTQRFVVDTNSSGTKFVFDDSAESYTADKVTHIPNKYKWCLDVAMLEDSELMLRGPAVVARASFPQGYTRATFAMTWQMQGFIRGLGYGYAAPSDYSTPIGIFNGTGEHCRMGQICLSPTFGAYVRLHTRIYTDLPLIPTPPIDAGITKFCETCGICATQCPYGAIPQGASSWESNCGENWDDDRDFGGSRTMWNQPGYKGWRVDFRKCGGMCISCKAACPFNTTNQSFIHSAVKASISNAPVFNSFFATMEEFIHFGKTDKDPDSWWDQAGTSYGINPAFLRK